VDEVCMNRVSASNANREMSEKYSTINQMPNDSEMNKFRMSRSELGHDKRPNRIGQKMWWVSGSFFRARQGLYYINP